MFPILMCFLTLATAARYRQVAEARRSAPEYNFLIKTDADGVTKIRSYLAEENLHAVRGQEVGDGLYRITVRCPSSKVATMWSIMSDISGRREER